MITIDLHENIQETGFGSIHLLDELFKIRGHIIQNEADWEISQATWTPDFIKYTYKEAVDFVVNVHLGCITSMCFRGHFKGKLWSQIGIGDTVKKLVQTRDDVYFDGPILHLKNNFNLIFDIDNQGMDISSLEAVLDHKIVSISISKEEYDAIEIGAQALPQTWKQFLQHKHSG